MVSYWIETWQNWGRIERLVFITLTCVPNDQEKIMHDWLFCYMMSTPQSLLHLNVTAV